MSKDFEADRVEEVVKQLDHWRIVHEVRWDFHRTKANIKINVPLRGRKRFLTRNADLFVLCGFWK